MLLDLASLTLEQHSYAVAELYYTQALSLVEKILGLDTPQVHAILIDLKGIYAELGNQEKLEEIQQRLNQYK